MKTINKSLAVLDLFLTGANELSLDDVARISHINKSTARRIVMSLAEYGFLKQPHKRGKYSLGLKFLDFSQAVKKNIPITKIAEPYLTELKRTIDETVSLAVWDGKRAMICLSIHPNHPLKVISYDGTMFDLHHSSLGKAIMAELSEAQLDTLLTRDLTRFTPNTITDANELKRHLIIAQRDGVAIDDEEGFPGVRGIASTIKDEGNEVVGAITILGPTIRLTREKMKDYIPLVKECSLNISRSLGYKGK